MNDELLASYLNDHLAGSVVAVETLTYCRDNRADADLAAFLDGLLREIEADRDVLEDLIGRFDGEQSKAKKSAAWLAEKGARLKTASNGEPAGVAFGRMEQLELLMLGIRGKLALWEVLGDLAGADSRLAGFDWGRLKSSAADQIKRVDGQRLRAAREAFLASDRPLAKA